MPQNNYRISFDLDLTWIQSITHWGEIFEFISYESGHRFHYKAAGDRLLWRLNDRFDQGRVHVTWLELKWEIRTPTSDYVEIKIPDFTQGSKCHIDLKLINDIATIWVDGVVANGVGKAMGPAAKSTVTSSLWMASETYKTPGEMKVDNFEVFRL